MGWQTEVAEILIAGNTTIINSQGEFKYSGTPAINKLYSSSTNSTGVDPYGNAYLKGDTTYILILGNWYACNVDGITIQFYTATTEAGPWTAVGNIQYSVVTGVNPGIIINTGTVSFKLDNVIPELQTNGGNLRLAQGFAVAADPNAFPFVDETWHSFAGSLLNGWATTAAGVAAYRLTNAGEIEFTGALNGGAATSVNITSIPSGPYRPLKTLTWPCGCSAGVIAGQSTFLQLSTGGTLFVNGLTPGTVSQAITLNGGGPLTGT